MTMDPPTPATPTIPNNHSLANPGGKRACHSHDYDAIRPIVLASWRLAQHSASDLRDKTEVMAESRVLQEVLSVPHTKVKLVYNSARATGYHSTIELGLTPKVIPETLKMIHLRITIEGVLFEKTFEADPDLSFTYAWKRLNVYRQRVHGITTAVVKVGYEYSDCPHIIWSVQTKKISRESDDVTEVVPKIVPRTDDSRFRTR